MYKRAEYHKIKQRLEEDRMFIQLAIGARQYLRAYAGQQRSITHRYKLKRATHLTQSGHQFGREIFFGK